MAQGLGRRGFQRSSHGVVELVPRDQVPSIHIIATSQSRFDRYLGLTVLLFEPSDLLVMDRYLIHTIRGCVLLYGIAL